MDLTPGQAQALVRMYLWPDCSTIDKSWGTLFIRRLIERTQDEECPWRCTQLGKITARLIIDKRLEHLDDLLTARKDGDF